MLPAIEWWAPASWLLPHAGCTGFARRSALAHAGRAATSLIFVFFVSFVAAVVTWRPMCRIIRPAAGDPARSPPFPRFSVSVPFLRDLRCLDKGG